MLNSTASTEIYPLSLHDALPIYRCTVGCQQLAFAGQRLISLRAQFPVIENRLGEVRRSREGGAGSTDRENSCRQRRIRSEEHTSELQSHSDLVCRLLLEKKKPQL